MRAIGVAVFLGVLGIGGSARAGTVTVEQHSGRDVRVFVPTTPASPTPLVVMLHGCTQSADDFADATQMDALAEKEGFVVAYPEQPAAIIPTKCFRWYDPAHQARGAGEPKDLADTADAVAAGHGVDPERVYVAGISAGAAMAVILGATYPDRFTAIGVVAGIEYKGATSLSEGLSVPGTGGPDPEAQGDLAVAAMGAYARVVPTFVVHGTADGVVAKVNGDQVHAQWLRTNTVVLGPGAVAPTVTAPGSAGYTFQHLVDGSVATGASVLEYYVVDGLGHAWPGGKAGGSFSDPKGPDASALVWAFFKGRTRTAPLAVAPPATTPGSPTTPGEDGGAPIGDPAADGGDGAGASPASSSASREGERDGGGCAVSHESPSAPWLGIGALLALASILGARRSRRA